MKIYHTNESVVIQQGPAIGVGVFLVCFFGIFLFAGMAAILAYFGFFPSESPPGIEALIVGVLLSAFGAILVFVGIHVLFHYTRFTFSNPERVVVRFEKWLWGTETGAFPYGNLSIETKRTRDSYRSGKADSLFLKDDRGDRLILIEDEPRNEIATLANELSCFTGLRGIEGESVAAGPVLVDEFRYILPKAQFDRELLKNSIRRRLIYASGIAIALGGFMLIAGLGVSALLGRSIFDDYLFYEILICIVLLFFIGLALAPAKLRRRQTTGDRSG